MFKCLDFPVSLVQGSYPLSGIHVTRLEDGDHHKNAFELAGSYLVVSQYL